MRRARKEMKHANTPCLERCERFCVGGSPPFNPPKGGRGENPEPVPA
jgi:hypothetical protein